MQMDREKRETAFVEQFLKLKASKLKTNAAFEIIQKMGYTGSRRTMNRHIASVHSTGHALSVVKKDRSHSSLDVDQMSILNTWILGQNTKNSPVGYSDVQNFIHDKFNIKVCQRTAGNYLYRLGHSQRSVRVKQVDLTRSTPN
jgi:hypothetical protein